MGIKLSQANVDLLLDHPSETRGAIRLFATRLEVKRINDEKFAALRSTAREYRCYDHFKWNEKHGNLKNKGDRGPDGSLIALREHRFEANVQLKKGMLVVLLYNLDLPHGLVNGSQGTIQGFEDFDPAKLPKAATNRRGAEDAMMPGVQVLQGDLASFQEDQIKQYARQMTFNKWPVVRFLNGVERTIYANCKSYLALLPSIRIVLIDLCS
jgi:ATP-dependent DNA helicase PIF1